MSRGRIALGHYLDKLSARTPSLAWFREYRDYLGDPRLLPIEVWVRYAVARQAVVWPTTTLHSEMFWRHSDYPLLRQLIHRRHTTWRVVLVTMRDHVGSLIEFGCGIAPVSAWVSLRRPWWNYYLIDVKSAHRNFGEWRVHRHVEHEDWNVQAYEDLNPIIRPVPVITALDVFEHLADPLETARQLVARLAPGGYLHWNFVESPQEGLDLASAGARYETLGYLRSALRVVWACPTHIVSILATR